MSREFIIANRFLIGSQALLVAVTGAGMPRFLDRLKGPGWALILPLSIAIVVAAIAAIPQVADGITWIALILVPIGAALALGWAMQGARPPLALLAAPAFAFAWWQTGTLAGDAVAAALTVLSAITVGRLLAGLVPGVYLRLGIIAMATIDAYLVFTEKLQGPNATLNAAVPVPGAPQLQYLELHYASMGYGDIFVAGVLGGVLAAERQRQLPAAVLVLILCIGWDLLFLHFNTLPATVPIAIATALLWLIPKRPGVSTASSSSSPPAPPAASSAG
jgi:hypothetical protein